MEKYACQIQLSGAMSISVKEDASKRQISVIAVPWLQNMAAKCGIPQDHLQRIPSYAGI